MNKSNGKFRLVDFLLVLMMILPVAAGIVIKVLTTPQKEGIIIEGAMIFAEIPFPVMPILITETQVNSWLIMISIIGLALYLTHGIRAGVETKRQYLAEWIVESCQNMVSSNMGGYFKGFAPFITALLGLSAFSSLMSLTGLFPPTSDLNTTAGWALLTFILITYYKMKCGPVIYLKSFAEPPALAPLNIISEFATPISMAFRHYGNVLSGSVISVLVAAGLTGLSQALLGRLPGFLGEFPFLRIGIPAVLSVYFDIFSGLLQAYIFAMLTMLYVAGAFPEEEYKKRHPEKA